MIARSRAASSAVARACASGVFHATNRSIRGRRAYRVDRFQRDATDVRVVCSLVLGAGVAFAHAGTDALDPSVEVREREPARLPSVDVKAPRDAIESPPFPSTAAGIDAQQIRRQINIVDAEDAVKYLPSLFVRKRNLGDTQPVLATRTWGVGSSARTLVYVDDVPISALIANNNTIGAPRWGIVAASGIERVTMLYGPFSAAYPGNSVGGVLRIETQRSDDTRFTFAQTMALQDFDGYRTRGDYPTSQASATFSGRSGDVSWLVGGDVLNSFSQPLSYITAAKIPDGTTGAIPRTTSSGSPPTYSARAACCIRCSTISPRD
jgi:iron complex outermembrane receptor protein